MRLLLFPLGIWVGIVGFGKLAEAQNYPWCAMLNMGDQAVNCRRIAANIAKATGWSRRFGDPEIN